MHNIEKIINYTFQNQKLLEQALTHASLNSEKNYERLEFIGDSIITFFTSNWLYKKFDEDKEGTLSIKRAQLINKNFLSNLSKSLKLYEHIKIQNKIPISDRIHCDIFESITGAIYLDSNYDAVSNFLSETLINSSMNFSDKIDFKGELISYQQKKIFEKIDVNTDLIEDTKTFLSTINIENKHYFYGFAENKVQAEQRASKIALKSTKKRLHI